jgi:hypothetical protein
MNMNMAMNGGKDIKMNLNHEHVHEQVPVQLPVHGHKTRK